MRINNLCMISGPVRLNWVGVNKAVMSPLLLRWSICYDFDDGTWQVWKSVGKLRQNGPCVVLAGILTFYAFTWVCKSIGLVFCSIRRLIVCCTYFRGTRVNPAKSLDGLSQYVVVLLNVSLKVVFFLLCCDLSRLQNYMIPLKQVFTPQEMEAIFINLEVRKGSSRWNGVCA